MSIPAPLKFDPSLRSFPTFRGMMRCLLAAVTLGRSGAVDRVDATVDRFNLPDPLRSLVLRTTRATGLWASERADVARELASHFRCGLDAGAEAGTLAESFGTIATSAALIRRAAKRKRPLAWHMWAWFWKGLGMLLAVGVLVYALLAARYFAGSPTLSHNYFKEFNKAMSAVPERDRAWPEYRRALMGMPNWPNSDIQNDWPLILPDDPQYTVARAYIQAAQPQLDIIRAAARRPQLGCEWKQEPDIDFEVRLAQRRGMDEKSIAAMRDSARLTKQVENPEVVSVLLPHLGQIRAMARDLMFDAAVARREGDADRVTADLQAILGIADQTGKESTLIGQLVGYAVLHVGADELRRTLTETPSLLSDDQLTGVAHALASCIEPGVLAPDMSGERVFMDDLLQRTYTDDGHGDGRLTNEGLSYMLSLRGMNGEPSSSVPRRWDDAAERAKGPIYAQTLAGRKEMLAEYGRLLALAEADCGRPAWVRLADPARGGFEKVFDDQSWRKKYMPISILIPAVDKTWWSAQSISLERDGACVAVACELFRRGHGGWPATLGEIPRSLLPQVPLDPFTGRPILYRLVDGAPVVYSTGNDLDDDGGKAPPVPGARWSTRRLEPVMDGDLVLWPLIDE